MDFRNLKHFLDENSERFNTPDFISDDPISIPHQFQGKQDREISGFLTAVLAWGQRPVILRNAAQLMEWMDHSPFDFILNHQPSERKPFRKFVHRTFQGDDAVYFLKALQKIYRELDGLEAVFSSAFNASKDMGETISGFKKLFLSFNAPSRTSKHLADPLSNSAAKRICMYLRWMVRKDNNGVDFGIWNNIPVSALQAPLDLHSGNIARELGLLQRKQDDWKAVTELTEMLRQFDPDDPVRYDFALYGAGVAKRYAITS